MLKDEDFEATFGAEDSDFGSFEYVNPSDGFENQEQEVTYVDVYRRKGQYKK